jgi:two-component system NtrC family sensor kinase
VLFTFGVLLLVNPLRSRLQNFVDRVFFRTSYNAAQVLAGVGRELASSLTREQIAALVQGTVEAAVPNSRTRLFVAARPGDALRDVGGTESVPPRLVTLLGQGRLVTAFDPTESFPDPATHDVIRTEMAALQAEIAVPLALRDELVGVLTTGAKRTGLFYTAGDAEFLRALAQQAAIALENARSYEALVELNARLEARVGERTAQLEGANRELADATAELKEAGVQLVQSEKMASLGQLVAGVAHEINTPLGSIHSNTGTATSAIALLEKALARPELAAHVQNDRKLERALLILKESSEVNRMASERIVGIVGSLRNFARLDEAERKTADLHEGIDSTLTLLRHQTKNRIEVVKDYGELARADCYPNQLNQVFMNVLVNAVQAMDGKGTITITTRQLDGQAVLTFRDTGKGIAAENLKRVFSPGFTTKGVGVGTGLGLSIAYRIMEKHGGTIECESEVGVGTTFTLRLPTGPRASG